MRDIRCPRCGSLMGRVDGEAQLRCRRARCYAIVNVSTITGEATMIRYGAGTQYIRCNETTSLDAIDLKYLRGEFPQP
jgi:phage FluMu protein Com